MLASIGLMLAGVGLYMTGIDRSSSASVAGVLWAIANNFLAITDRLLQRLMLSKDQCPVDISKTGATLLNNVLGMFPLLIAAFLTNEFPKIPEALSQVDTLGAFWIGASCVVGVGISYTGIWVQSLISATSFLVMVNVNKFAIIFLEAYVLPHVCLHKPGHSGCLFQGKYLTILQILGAVLSILGGVAYGKAREWAEASKAEEEDEAMLSSS